MKNNKWFYINDFTDFVNSARKMVFKFFGEQTNKDGDNILSSIDSLTLEELDELDDVLSFDESSVIVKNHAKLKVDKATKTEKYFITDKILYEIIEELNSRMVSNILNSLVNKGVLESGFDSEINDFIFWIKDNDAKEIQKPETD